MQTGTVIRGIGGFYEVVLNEGTALRCRPRGRLKKERGRILVGDRVHVQPTAPGEGTVEMVLPRHNELRRPPIANVDQVLVVMALAEPAPDKFFLDCLLVAVSAHGLPALLCLNKADRVSSNAAEALALPYRSFIEHVFITSARAASGIDDVHKSLRGRVTTLAGPSGVGKSALLNALCPGFRRLTGDVSRKLQRGRHTTRAVELLPLPAGGWVADTPGFSQIDLGDVRPEELAQHFPDFTALERQCRFAGCFHRNEPGCAVREAAESEQILPWRYRHYVQLLEELQEAAERRYR